MQTLTALTGKGYQDWDLVQYNPEEKFIPEDAGYATLGKQLPARNDSGNRFLFAAVSMVGLLSLVGFRRRK